MHADVRGIRTLMIQYTIITHQTPKTLYFH